MAAAGDEKLDPHIVAELYLQHGDELKRFLNGVLRDAQLANDVLQITYTKLIEKGHETREESRKSWLFRVAYREAMAIRRRQVVGRKVVERVAWTTEFHATFDDSLVRLEGVQKIRAAMDSLPPNQRQIVCMRIYEEKTFAVIADELGIPLGTALGRMRMALKKLRSSLESP